MWLADSDQMPDLVRPAGSTATAHPASHPVGWGFIALYALAFISTSLLFLAPLLVTLALKVNSLVGTERAPNSLSLAALVAVLPDQVPPAQRGSVSGVLGVCLP